MSETKEAAVLETDDCVRERYSAASKEQEAALCCPVVYDTKYLEVIPQEIIDRDYGCGDPSPYVRPGDTVVDLGSGGGKLCYIISQQVGSDGKVIGVDVNSDMLQLARSHQADVAGKIGYSNVEFRRGRIQDLAIDFDQMANEVSSLKLDGAQGMHDLIHLQDEIREKRPMIPDNSVDCVVSNCVLNLVKPADRLKLFAEIYRVLKPGGRAAISDIVSDEDVPMDLQNDPTLWSGCISGAWREDKFVDEFTNIGFEGAKIDKRQEEAWQTVKGIEFRSVTILAFKPFSDICLERNQAVIYRGPFEKVSDDDGHTYKRGQRTAICEKTFQMLSEQTYAENFFFIEPVNEVPREKAELFDCSRDQLRHPRETKGQDYDVTQLGDTDCCGGDTNCC
ncbi:MAG: methyltransferase domain-containing protein [Planctomycetota bacterium]